MAYRLKITPDGIGGVVEVTNFFGSIAKEGKIIPRFECNWDTRRKLIEVYFMSAAVPPPPVLYLSELDESSTTIGAADFSAAVMNPYAFLSDYGFVRLEFNSDIPCGEMRANLFTLGDDGAIVETGECRVLIFETEGI